MSPIARVKKRSSLSNADKIKFNFDISILNVLIYYTQCDFIAKADLYKLKKLIDFTDIESYKQNIPIYSRLNILKSFLNSIVDKELKNFNLLCMELRNDFESGLEIIDELNFKDNKLTYSECVNISKFISEKLRYIEVYQKKDRIIELLQNIDNSADYNVSYYDTFQELKKLSAELTVSLQEDEANQKLLKEFSFSDPNARNILAKIVTDVKKPSAILQTGIRQLNAILAPGFRGVRLYTILGGTGKFKSGTLLNLADQIRRFNPQICPLENGFRKTILFITLENSIEESVERIFDMYSQISSDIRNISTEDFISTFEDDGGFTFSTNHGIDITFVYAGNLEMSTAEIPGLISRLNTKGLQPICIILDYIKRIDSAHDSKGDERVRMSFVAKELKSISQYYNIPVITAMQLNRDGNGIIDASMRDNKQDVARFIGQSSIGNCWDIMEDSDWVCLINPELQISTQKLFLTFKRLKIRGKKIPFAVDYFNHPFTNDKNIRLETDCDKPEPISIISLANDLESIKEDSDIKDDNNSTTNRLNNLQEIKKSKASSKNILTTLRGVKSSDLLK